MNIDHQKYQCCLFVTAPDSGKKRWKIVFLLAENWFEKHGRDGYKNRVKYIKLDYYLLNSAI